MGLTRFIWDHHDIEPDDRLLTPPVGMVLYVLVGMSDVPMEKIVKCMLPFILVLSVLLLIITFVPGISMFLPTLFFD